MASCEKQTQNEATTHRLSFSFANGNSMYKSTKGASSDIFDEFYAKLSSGELVAETYNLTFTEIESGAAYTFTGAWETATVELQAATYKVTGASTAVGENSQEKCSICFDETITVTNQMTDIVLNAYYDCYLFVLTSEKIANVDNCFLFNNKYWYAFVNGNFIGTLTGTHKDGSKFSVEMGNYSFEKGKYYIYYDISINEYGISFLIPKMEDGANNDGCYIDEYGVNYGNGISVNGVTWAPVNCGYKPASDDRLGFVYGKLYQWGRKYGQGYCAPYYDPNDPYKDEGSITIASQWKGNNKDADMNTFYYGTSPSFNWISNVSSTFWNKGTNDNPIKNEDYDPCPDGWRVPTLKELSTLIECTYSNAEKNGIIGRWFFDPSDNSKCVFFPFAGARFSDNAIHSCGASQRGLIGQYWASSNHIINIHNSLVGTDGGNATYLAFGHSVRCVADKN